MPQARTRVIASDGSIDIYNPHAVRSSLGALLPPRWFAGKPKIISWLKSNNIKIICALPQADLAYTAVNFRESCAIVLGSEDKGLGTTWKDSADYRVHIPMLGKSDSLNVATAAGVLLMRPSGREKWLGLWLRLFGCPPSPLAYGKPHIALYLIGSNHGPLVSGLGYRKPNHSPLAS